MYVGCTKASVAHTTRRFESACFPIDFYVKTLRPPPSPPPRAKTAKNAHLPPPLFGPIPSYCLAQRFVRCGGRGRGGACYYLRVDDVYLCVFALVGPDLEPNRRTSCAESFGSARQNPRERESTARSVRRGGRGGGEGHNHSIQRTIKICGKLHIAVPEPRGENLQSLLFNQAAISH